MNNTEKHIWEEHYPEGATWDTEIKETSLPDFFDFQANKFADRPFLNFFGKEWDYKTSLEMTNKIAKGLQSLGVTKDTKVGLFLPNTPYSVWFYYAVLKAGGTVVNYNPLYTEKELEHQVEDSQTDIIITLDLAVLYDKILGVMKDTRLKKLVICPFTDILPFPKNILFPIAKFKERAKVKYDEHHVKFDTIINNDGEYKRYEINPTENVAVLQYTGGTTGTPKGAMLTHQNIYANAAQVSLWMAPLKEGNEQLTMVGVLPFFHVFAMTAVMNMSIYHGMRILLQPRFDLDMVLKLVDKEKPDLFAGVPAIYNAIAKHPKISKYDFSSLRFCISGGAPLPGEVKKRFEEATKCPNVAEGYGLTEASPVTNCNPVCGQVKVGTIGLPLPQTIVEILDRDDKKTVLPQGEKGEVCIRGPQVMKGYFNKPEETAKTIMDGRLHTGDVGFIDEEGYVTLVDRIKDLIIVRGYNVYPSQIEEAIYQHPAVEECIVAGVPDEERGETVWAWIKPTKGTSITSEEMKDFLDEMISPIEMPRKFIIRDQDLPKTTVGKLSRKDLLEQEGIKRV
jgi:long-chain acyl-CoA synthetase